MFASAAEKSGVTETCEIVVAAVGLGPFLSVAGVRSREGDSVG